MKIAIVHEMLIKLGGAEKVVENWMKNYPDADIFTLIYDEKKVGKIFPKEKISSQVSRLPTQIIYRILGMQRFCLPFMSRSVEDFDLSQYDAILVSSSAFAHGIITKPETKVFTYYHSPARYLWDWTNEYKKDIGFQKGIRGYILNSLFLKIRQWDFIASRRNHTIIANSKNTAKRLKKYYKKDAPVLYPPIETERFSKKLQTQLPSPYEKYYIILSALTEFKRIDVAIAGFQKLPDVNLVIIGDGGHTKKLKNQAGDSENICFVGNKSGDELVSIVQGSSGLIFPGEEDFGIVPIEVMAAGKPVFALNKGGLTESVLPGKTGDFFSDAEGGDFVERFGVFHKKNTAGKYTCDACQKQAKVFDQKVFESEIKKLLS